MRQIDPTLVVPVLAYHQIEPLHDHLPAREGLVVDATMFRWQMLLLRALGYRTVGLDDLAGALACQRPLPRRSIVLTFDDGYQGTYEWAFPILQRYQMTATLFLIAEDFVEGSPALAQRAFPVLTRAQVFEMLAGGLSVGSHTISHARLVGLTGRQAEHEIAQSKTILECAFGQHLAAFCYPYGACSARLESIVASAGYCCGVTTRFGRRHRAAERYTLRRIPVGAAQNLAHFIYRLRWAREQ